MAQHLVSRGLEPASAAAAVAKHFDMASKQVAVHVHFFTAIFPEVGRAALIRYGAERAMRSEAFDLRSYDHLTAMLQHLYGPALPSSFRSRAMHCAMLNRSVG